MTREENSISLFTERREESSSHARISTNEERNTLLLPILSRANDSSTPKISNFFYTIMLSLPISFISNEYITRIMGQARLCLPRLVCPFFPLSLLLSPSPSPPLAYIETKRILDESRIGGTTFIEIGPGRLNNSPYRRRVAGRCCRDFRKSRKACTSIRSVAR